MKYKLKNIEIKNRFTEEVMYSSSKTIYKDAVEEAVKSGVNLSEADFYGANLRGVNLSEAGFYEANLRGANLRGAKLCGADLRGANLSGANLRGADFYGANLSGADLNGANLSEANLRGAKFYGRGSRTRINKSQIDDFLAALGVVAE